VIPVSPTWRTVCGPSLFAEPVRNQSKHSVSRVTPVTTAGDSSALRAASFSHAGCRIRADCGDEKHKNHASSGDYPGTVCIADRLRQS